MKRIPPIISSLVISILFNTLQAQTYQLMVSQEPFVYLENAALATEEAWTEPVFQVPIGFDFQLFDLTSDTLYSYFNSFGGVLEVNLDEDHLYMLIPFYCSLIDRGYSQDSALSPIQYKTEGLPGQQVFTLEFKEAGLFEGPDNEDEILRDYVSFQIKLYEANGDIEFRYGPYSTKEEPSVIFDPFTGPIVGLLADADWNNFGGGIGELILLEGDPLKPTIVTDTSPVVLAAPIPENTVYRFSRTTAVGDLRSSEHEPLLFPNPTSGEIHIKKEHSAEITYPITVTNVLGAKVAQWNTESEISADELQSGLYYVIIHSGNKIFTEPLLVLPKT